MTIKLLSFFISLSFCTVAFAQAPVITVQPVGTAICEYNPLVLSLQAAGSLLSYQWYHNGTAIPNTNSPVYVDTAPSVQASGTYYCVVMGSENPLTASTSVVVTVNESPHLIGQPPSAIFVNYGEPLTLAVSATGNGLSYQWQKNNVDIPGANSPSYFVLATASDAGVYRCQISSPICPPVYTYDSTVTVLPLATPTNSFDTVKLSPNPASDKVTVQFGQNASNAEISVYGLQGKLLFSKTQVSGNEAQLDLSALHAGLYFVRIASAEGTSVKKLIIR